MKPGTMLMSFELEALRIKSAPVFSDVETSPLKERVTVNSE